MRETHPGSYGNMGIEAHDMGGSYEQRTKTCLKGMDGHGGDMRSKSVTTVVWKKRGSEFLNITPVCSRRQGKGWGGGGGVC